MTKAIEIKQEAAKRIKKLTEEINRHRYLYYALDKPEVSDHAFDSLIHELEKLENLYPDLIAEDSPTHRIGGEPLSHFKKVKHEHVMYSLSDVSSEKEFFSWTERISKLANKKEFDFFGELKIDGFAVSLIYKNGTLKTGATRGNGKIGEDVTQNLKTIRSLPTKLRIPRKEEINEIKLLPDKVINMIRSGEVEVRGEVFMSKNVFKDINRKQRKAGLSMYANPRNTAAGSIRQLNPKIAASRQLDFLAYDIVTDLGQETHKQKHDILKLIGFKTDKLAKSLKNSEEVFSLFNEIEKRREDLEWEIDGLVISINKEKIYKDLGVVGRSPRGAVALKFPAEQATTIVRDIIIQVGRTGVLTPVAVLEPVNIRGVIIKRATLHNMDEINRLGIKIGDTVVVERAGDVIPKIINILPRLRSKDAKDFKIPTECPICGGGILKDGVYYRCKNKNCPALKRQNLSHFVSRGAFNIIGLGPKILNKLYDEGLLQDKADIFSLGVEDIAPLEGLGEKSAQNIIKAIEKTKKAPLERFIYSLGILHVGVETAYDLAQYFGSIEKIKKANIEELEAVPNIGEVVAKSIYDWFKNPINLKLIDKFKEKGLLLVNPKTRQLVEQKLRGLTFVFTGSMEGLDRAEAERMVRELGAKASSSVSKKTSYLILGENPGSKYEEAKRLGVKVIDKKEFLKVVN